MLGGEAVEVDAEARGVERPEALGDEAGDYAGEDVAGAAGGEGGVGEGADASSAVGGGDDGVRALEDERDVPLGGEAAGDGEAVRLDLGDREAGRDGRARRGAG